VRLLENRVEAVTQLGKQEEEMNRNVIFRGVNRVNDGVESITLMRDLKMSSKLMRFGVDMSKTVTNLKSIL
jgi:hypothetical protein